MCISKLGLGSGLVTVPRVRHSPAISSGLSAWEGGRQVGIWLWIHRVHGQAQAQLQHRGAGAQAAAKTLQHEPEAAPVGRGVGSALAMASPQHGLGACPQGHPGERGQSRLGSA